MRLAALYDIHGNLPALEAVLGELERARVDIVVVGGDVFPGPMSREALETLMGLGTPVRFLRGNGETAVLAEARGADSGVPAAFRDGVQWSAAQLSPAALQTLESWPPSVLLHIDLLGTVLFCHATPRSETEIFTKSTPQDVLRPIFDSLGVDLVVCGHTHMQFERRVGSTLVVNAGSVGMPFGRGGAHWLLISDHPELRHTWYDLEAAALRIRSTSYPQADQFAAANVLQCPSEPEMLAAFARVELR